MWLGAAATASKGLASTFSLGDLSKEAGAGVTLPHHLPASGYHSLLAPSLMEPNAAVTLPSSTGGRKAGGAEGILTLILFTQIKRFSKAEMTARLHCRWRDSSICSTAMGSEAPRFLPSSEPASARAKQRLWLPGPECKCPEQWHGQLRGGVLPGHTAHSTAGRVSVSQPLSPLPMSFPLHHSIYSD